MNRLLPAALAAVALAGCTATAASNISVTPASPSPGTAATARPSGSPTAAPAASATPGATTPTATPIVAATTFPLGPGPTGGSLADVRAAYTGTAPLNAKYTITMQTTQGDIQLTLFPDVAAKSCEKFLATCRAGVYDGTSFHRVLAGFVAQGGDPLTKTLPENDPRIGTGGYGEAVPGDFDNGLKHLPGSLAYARSSDPNSAFSQFYICLNRLTSLDGNYTVFGQVTAGFDAVNRLQRTTDPAAKRDRVIKVTVTE